MCLTENQQMVPIINENVYLICRFLWLTLMFQQDHCFIVVVVFFAVDKIWH